MLIGKIMINFVKYSILIAFVCILNSCKDDPTQVKLDPNPVLLDTNQVKLDTNIVTLQLLDSATNKPLANKIVVMYYLLEKSGMETNIENFSYIPNFNTYKSEINFAVFFASNIRITRNDIYNDTLINEIYNVENLVAGRHTALVDIMQYDYGFSKLKLYCNNILSDSLSIFQPFRGTIVMEEPIRVYGNPYLELTTDTVGKVDVDIREFKNIGCRTRRYSADKKYIGTFELVNGFIAYTNGKNNTTYQQIIKVPELNNNIFSWYVPQ